MSHHRSAVRVFALGFIVTLLLSAALPMAALAKKPEAASLGLHDEQLLSRAVAEGRAQVTILVAAKGGEANAAASAITAAGGTINYRDNALGYLRATVATGKVRQIAAQPAVQAVDLDEVVQIPDPRPDAVQPLVTAARTKCIDPSGQPVHAHPGHRRGRVHRGAPRVGRPWRDDRHRRHRRVARSSEPADHQHGRAQGRRVGDRDGPRHRWRPDLDQHVHPGVGRNLPVRYAHLYGTGGWVLSHRRIQGESSEFRRRVQRRRHSRRRPESGRRRDRCVRRTLERHHEPGLDRH